MRPACAPREKSGAVIPMRLVDKKGEKDCTRVKGERKEDSGMSSAPAYAHLPLSSWPLLLAERFPSILSVQGCLPPS